jgi:murein DD-endopeptidase MepM/ murein hydrolase activator NlpD
MKRKYKKILRQVRTTEYKKEFVIKANTLIAQTYSSVIKPSSRFFRRIFEFDKIKQALGSLVVASVFTMAVFPASISAVQTNLETQNTEVQIETISFQTESAVRLPLDNFKISQWYTFFHHGIDFAAPKGTPIYTIAEGYVEKAEYSRFGFGNHVYINHGNGFKSLYAHLSKIEVKENEFVNTNSIIGLVGSTGWSTGPHLHFQVWENDKLINPKILFEDSLGKKLASTR